MSSISPLLRSLLGGPLLLNIRVSESFLRLLVMEVLPVDVVGDLMNQNIVQVEISQIIPIIIATQMKGVGTEKHARLPIEAITTQVAAP